MIAMGDHPEVRAALRELRTWLIGCDAPAIIARHYQDSGWTPATITHRVAVYGDLYVELVDAALANSAHWMIFTDSVCARFDARHAEFPRDDCLLFERDAAGRWCVEMLPEPDSATR